MSATESRYAIEKAEIAQAELVVSWGDGHRSRFHPIWLRHQCECRQCGTPTDAVRGLFIDQIPEEVAPAMVECSESTVKLGWSNDGHVSVYAARWLRDHCCSESERAKRMHRPTLWDGRLAENPPAAELGEMEASARSRLRMLRQVMDYGFCKVTGVPTTPGEAHRLIELVGVQRRSHYGDYVLSAKKDVDNVGDTCMALRPHTDEAYRLSSVGIIVFQVFQPSPSGGASTLVDGFEAARRMREAWPEDFDLLVSTPVFCERRDRAKSTNREPKWFQSRLPVIRLDADGAVSGVRLNERQIAPLDLPAEQIGPCYRALRRLFGIVYDPELRLSFELRAGEGLIFDNQRVLHGRTEFTPEEPRRSVLTCSVDLEEFHSSLRTLLQSLEGDTTPRWYRQGMAG